MQFVEESIGETGRTLYRALDANHTETFRVTAQVLGHQRRIKVQRVPQTRSRGLGIGVRKLEFPGISQRRARAVIVEARCEAGHHRLVPTMVEGASQDRSAEYAEGMPIGVPNLLPIAELDPELISCLGMAHKIRLIDTKETQHIDDRWNRRFPDANSANVG